MQMHGAIRKTPTYRNGMPRIQKGAKLIDLFEYTTRDDELIEELCAVWESSVRATHLFLSDSEICDIKRYVPLALRGVPHLVIAVDENATALGFMGIDGTKLEMLFISDACRGQGIGKRLLQHGMDRYSVNELAVNEQNPLARGFYEHMGFHVWKRTELDEQGNPYPLLYMRR